jgi:hypothetical protein
VQRRAQYEAALGAIDRVERFAVISVLRGKLTPYVTAAAGGAGLAALVLQIWKADLSIPLFHRRAGDGLFYEMLVKGMIDNGSYLGVFRLTGPSTAPRGGAIDYVEYEKITAVASECDSSG